MNTINVENCKTLLIGRRGENEVTTVAFDFTEWASEFGIGVVDLYVKRFGDDSAYPVLLTIDGTVASWLVTETDTNVSGYGKAEYVYRVDGKIAKSAVFPFFVADDIGQPASEPPDPYESWLEQLTALGAETEAHAQAAEQSAEDSAQSAEDAAESAASAEGYAGQAETAAGLAQAAQTASEAARDAAQTAQASAESSATAASGSAASAASSATAAVGSAASAASSATAAVGSASDASSSASAAGASATAASASATTASNAATAAQTAQSAAEDAAADAQQAAQQAHVEYEQLSGEVDDLSDEVSQQKSALTDINAGNSALILIPNEYAERDGTITNYANWSRTDYIPVKSSVKVTSDSPSRYCCFYDSEKAFVSNVSITTGQTVLTVPDNAVYLIVSNQTAKMQAVKIESVNTSRLNQIEPLLNGLGVIAPNGANDMKTVIETALSTYGKVQLLKGDYYTTGLFMPSGSEIYGCGEDTRIILMSSVEDGACITTGGDNAIKNITFTQIGANTIKPGTATIGAKDGIRVLNEASLCRIENCNFYGFKRAGVYGNTVGHSSYQSIIIDDCRFVYCEIGLYFDYWTEYAVVSNSYMSQCYNGVRNNAGNNMFVGCHFDGNDSAFVMMTYNISGANDGHGSCIGCTFNHSDNYSVYVRGGSHGFLFVGCHFYYGNIYLRSCTGIVFDSCQSDGTGGITFFSGSGHRFVNVSFVATPTITEASATASQNVRFINCYLLDGSAEVVYPTD